MSLISTPMLSMVERLLDVAAFRQSLISSNIANVDTPRYRTRDIDFRSELVRAQHQADRESWRPLVRQVSGLMERPDGNNVSLERESLLLAQTQLQFRAGVRLLRAEFRYLLTAINEGR